MSDRNLLRRRAVQAAQGLFAALGAFVSYDFGMAIGGLPMGLLMAKTLNGTHPLRFAGALGTYLTGLALSVTLLLKVF